MKAARFSKPERQFIHQLFQISARSQGPETFRDFLNKQARFISWTNLLQSLREHGLAPWIFHRLRFEGSLALLPEAARKRLMEEYRSTAVQNFFVRRELSQVAGLFARAGVRWIPIKGAALLNRWYHPAALRPMQDLDLLVRPEDWPKTRRLLLQAGYGPQGDPPATPDEGFHFHAGFFTPGRRLLVEVHWRPADEQTLPGQGWATLWDRTGYDDAAGFRRPAGTDQFLLHCLHLNKHGVFNGVIARQPDLRELIFDPLSGNRLIWFLDLHLLMEAEPNPDLDQLLARARDWQTVPALYASLVLTAWLFGSPPPWTWPETLPPPPVPGFKHRLLSRLARGLRNGSPRTRALVRRLQTQDPDLQLRPIRGLDLLDRLALSSPQREGRPVKNFPARDAWFPLVRWTRAVKRTLHQVRLMRKTKKRLEGTRW